MSNFFILISDRPIKCKSKQIKIPNSIQKEINFVAKYGYKIEPDANDRKELITKQFAPDLYDKTNDWFIKLQNIIENIKNEKGNIVLIETYYDQDLEDIIWICEKFPISKFNNEELSFEFETIYTMEL